MSNCSCRFMAQTGIERFEHLGKCTEPQCNDTVVSYEIRRHQHQSHQATNTNCCRDDDMSKEQEWFGYTRYPMLPERGKRVKNSESGNTLTKV